MRPQTIAKMHSQPLQNVSADSITQKYGKLKRVENIIKSQQDCREYRGLQLENGLKVLLISDPATDISAAAMCVRVGYMSDPDYIPGLAHFCEHMLFLGTEKYPDENDYSTYLSKNGGSSNAATYSDNTRYHFDVAPDKLDGALDRFAQFFISPLFTESATLREINAVNSEHEKNIPVDAWRLRQVNKFLGKTDHPYSKFGTGNKDTLLTVPTERGINTREELMKFHDKWYSANIMCLAVIGKESLDELEEMVVPKFSQIVNKNISRQLWQNEPYSKEQYGTKVYIVPVKDIRALTLSFTIDDLSKHYKSNPGHYVSHLIGHEGKGSILSELRKQGWCNGLYSSHTDFIGGFGFFDISISLTEEGLEKIDEIVEYIFQYIKMLQERKPDKWIFDELYNLNELGFRFKDKEDPTSLVNNLSDALHLYPLEEVLSAPWLSDDWRPDLITDLLDCFMPEKCRIVAVGQKFEKDTMRSEPWYGTKFEVEKISTTLLQKWKDCQLNENFILPEPNPFIPTDFTIMREDSDSSKHPIIILDSPTLRVWHKQDSEFLKPKTFVNIDISSPIVSNDPLNFDLTHMLVALFKDNLNEYLYNIELAGLRFNISTSTSGVSLQFSGYSHKQKVLIEKVLDHLFDFKIDPQRFEILKEEFRLLLKNFVADQPYQHSLYYLALILVENAWSKSELEAAIKCLTPERLEWFLKEFLSRFHAECFIYGNINKQAALDVADIISNKINSTNSVILPLLSRQLLLKREYKLPEGESYLFKSDNKFHKSSCAQLYLQCGIINDTSSVFVDLVAQVLNEPCYNILRTQEQLGYIVHLGSRKTTGTTGIKIIVQSDKHPEFVETRIECFLKEMLGQLEKMSESDFNAHKEALISKKLEKPKKLSVVFHRYLSEISISSYHFERDLAEVAILRKITKQELLNFYKAYIDKDSPARRSLMIHIVSGINDHDKETLESVNQSTKEPTSHLLITDLTVFKSSRELYPIAKPHLDITPKGARSKL